MNQDKNSTQIRISKNLIIGIVAFAIVLGGVVCFFSGPKPSWYVKMQVKSFLKKNSGKRDFSVNFKFPSKAEMEKAPAQKNIPDEKSYKGKLTKKDFQTLCDEYIKLKSDALKIEGTINTNKLLLQLSAARLEGKQEDPDIVLALTGRTNATLMPNDLDKVKEQVKKIQDEIETNAKLLAEKEGLIKPILSDLIDFQLMFKDLYRPLDASESGELAAAQSELIQTMRQKFEEATTYSKMYEFIGQELWVADKLFGSKNPEHLRTALRLARQAAQDAVGYAQNFWLAARIYEAYVLPNVDIIASGGNPRGRRNNFTAEGLLNETANVFQMNEEQENVIRCYKKLLAIAPDSPRADFTRVQIASIYDQKGDKSKAVHYLKEIKSTNTLNFVMRRFPSLQQYLK